MTQGYPIGAVSRMTGLSTDTIRAWERRHALVRPERSSGGVRLYSTGDVTRLELAREAVTLGHPIGRVARLGDAEIRGLIGATSAGAASMQSSAAAQTVAAIMRAVSDYDFPEVESLLGSSALLFTPSELIVDVLAPLMRAVGDGWEAGRISVAQEHCTSHLVRNLVGSMMRLRPQGTRTTMLFATPSGESHELGTLFAACLAAVNGFRALVLGPNVPAPELVRIARKLAPARVVIGVVLHDLQGAVAEYIADVRRGVPPATQVTLGGTAAAGLQERLPDGVDVIAELAQFTSRVGRPA